VKEALENNPEIKTAIAKWQGTAKRPSQESALPNPEIGISYKNVSFNKLTLGDDDFTELSVYASQEIPFPGKLSLKGKIAKEETEAEKNLADAVVRTVVADLKKAYYDWYLVNKSIEITSKNKELIEKFTKISEAKYEVGKGIQQDVIRAQLEVSVFLERLELLKRQKEIIEAKIRSLLNRSSNSPLGIPENIQKSKLKLTLDDLYKLAGNQSPMLNAKKNLIEKSGKALELAKKQYLPDFVGEFGWFSRGEFTNRGAFADEWVARVGFIVPIYFWKKERFGVEEASYKLEEMKQDYNSTNQNLNFEIKEKYITAKTSEKLLDLYQNGIIPQSTLSRESAISGYRVGDVDFLTLIDSSVAVFNFELEYIKQLVEYEKALAGLEEIVGYDLKSLNNEVIK
ncbi:MAG: TolC family protein, partial [Thermodesulfobacteriota bacterium]